MVVIFGGVIFDCGLFVVYFVIEWLLWVGEFDEEMVYEFCFGDVILLGVISW